ncbi:MAG: AsmA family protein [Pseudomonadota bacterium]
MKRFWRYFGLAAAIVFFLWVVALAVVYFLVDVDMIKKAAVKAVNENTNGELSLGEVKLKLFPMVHFEIGDLMYKSSQNFNRKTLFSSKQTNLSFGVFSLLMGKPNITLSLYDPAFNLISDGKINNIKDLVKPKAAGEGTAAVETKAEAKAIADKKSDKDALYYLFISRFTFKIKDAAVSYTSPKSKFDVKNVNLNLFIDPLVKTLDIELIAPVDGDVKLLAEIKPVGHDKLSVDATIDATKFNIRTKSFVKKSGVPLKIVLKGTADKKFTTVDVENFELTLVKQWLTGKGKLTGLDGEAPNVNIELYSGTFDAANFAKVLPALDALHATGGTTTRLKLSGTAAYMNLSADINATQASFSGEAFNKAAGVPLDVSASIGTDTKSVLDIKNIKLVLVDDILGMSGSVSNFSSKTPVMDINLNYLNIDTKRFEGLIPAIKKNKIAGKLNAKGKISGTMEPIPAADLDIKYSDAATGSSVSAKITSDKKTLTIDLSSASLDLNPYLPPEKIVDRKSGKKGGSAKGDSGAASSGDSTSGADSSAKKGGILSAAAKDEDLLKKEDVEKLKDLLSKFDIKLRAKASEIKFRKYVLRNFITDSDLTSQKLSINKISFDTFGGNISSSMGVGLDVKNPTYNGKLSVKDLRFKDASGVVMPELTGVVDGIVSSNLDISASGYKYGDVQKTLTGNGNLVFNNFRYSSGELNTTINDKLQSSIGKFTKTGNTKIFGSDPGWETVTATYTIKDQKILIEKLFAKDKEYEATGKGTMDFNNYIDFTFNAVVPYRNIPYEPLKVEGRDSSSLPLHLTGPAAKPKFHLEDLLAYLGEKAIRYETQKLKQKVEAEAQRIQGEIKAKANAEAERIKSEAKAKANTEVQKAGDKLKNAIKGIKF